MKTKRKALLLTFCAVLLVVASVLGTIAYLTANDTVANTFTVGQVAINLDEAKVNPDGTPVANADRVKENSYKLLPGHEYTKDPTVHVNAVSENSWIFVKVENGIAAYEANTTDYKQIADQITENGWTALDGVANVYYKSYAQNATGADLVVFENFKVSDTANTVDGWANITDITEKSTKVTVNAYAIQADGFDTAEEAWAAFPKGTTP